MKDGLVSAHGGELLNLIVDRKEAAELKKASKNWLSWDLSQHQICDLELLLNGSFSPLTGYLLHKDYESVCSYMRLSDNTIWPIPIILDVTEDFAIKVKNDQKVALRDPEGVMIAVLTIQDIWKPNHDNEAEVIYTNGENKQPGVEDLLKNKDTYYLGGSIKGIQLPEHYDFHTLRFTPQEVRSNISRLGWNRVTGYQPIKIMHRAQYELTRKVIEKLNANLLMQPLVGIIKPGDNNHFTRIRCYQALLPHYPKATAILSLLPLVRRLPQSREILLKAIISKNYGCRDLIVEFSSPSKVIDEMADKWSDELGIRLLPCPNMVYMEKENTFIPKTEIPEGRISSTITENELKERIYSGKSIPEWFTFTEIENELKRSYPPRKKQGFTVFFTGLSGSGKSTIARALMSRFMEIGGRPVTLLDGDIVRKNLSSELGFSREHRNINIRRIGFVASKITKNGGIAICAPIAPYDSIRKDVRAMMTSLGGFFLVHVATPLKVCEARDRKGLYAKAKAGLIKEFTGISDPYELPDDAELTIDTAILTTQEAMQKIVAHIASEGYLDV